MYLYYFMLANHRVYFRLARLTVAFKIIAIDFYCCILWGIIRKTSNYIYVLDPFQASYIGSINQSGSPKKNIYWCGTQKLPKNLNIYLLNYQTEAANFLATRHEKTIMACSYLNFSKYRQYIKTAKKWWLLWGIA